jgi:hypothetical protein
MVRKLRRERRRGREEVKGAVRVTDGERAEEKIIPFAVNEAKASEKPNRPGIQRTYEEGESQQIEPKTPTPQNERNAKKTKTQGTHNLPS